MLLTFPHLPVLFLIHPVVIANLAYHLNLGCRFNFKYEVTPQKVNTLEDGSNQNCYSIKRLDNKLYTGTVLENDLKEDFKENIEFSNLIHG